VIRIKNKRERIKNLSHAPMIPNDLCLGNGIKDLVSVIIPTYNRDYILGKSIDSVLMQDYHNTEIIIVDDGSKDNTKTLVETYLKKFPKKIKYIEKVNGGLVSARNEGLRHANGEFIAFQDSDDIWLQGKLTNQVAVLKKHSEVAIVWCSIHIVDENENIIYKNDLSKAYHVYNIINLDQQLPKIGELEYQTEKISYRKGNIFSTLFLGNLIHPPVAMMRRLAIQKAGGLDQTYHNAGEDYEFFWRISEFGQGALIENAGILYRMGAQDQLTSNELLVFIALGYLKAIHDRLKRFPDKLKSLGDKVIQNKLIEAYIWAIKSEFTSTFGSKRNGLSLFLDLLIISTKYSSQLVPFMVIHSLPLFLFKPLKNISKILKKN
jgi:glycosyltransferase involved in cell wall biosynthesis